MMVQLLVLLVGTVVGTTRYAILVVLLGVSIQFEKKYLCLMFY
jgi:hypothetical protein